MDDFEEAPRPVLKKTKISQNRKNKLVLVFDEKARKDYLTGFQKRKNERRKKAKLENEKRIKEERQELKQKVREMIKKSDMHRVPEVEHLLDETVLEYDLPEHTVTLTDVSGPTSCFNAPADTSQNSHDDKDQSEEKKGAEDMSTLKKKKKNLIHKLATVGNKTSKRLGKGKFRGGGKGGGGGGGKKFKGRDSSQSRSRRKNNKK